MKQAHYNSRSNDKITNSIKVKATSKIDKKHQIIRKLDSQNTEASKRPGNKKVEMVYIDYCYNIIDEKWLY